MPFKNIIHKYILILLATIACHICYSQEVNIIPKPPINFSYTSVASSNSGTLVAAAIYPANDIMIYEAVLGRPVMCFSTKANESPYNLFFTKDDDKLVAVFRDKIAMYDVRSGKLESSLETKYLYSSCYNSDEGKLALSTGDRVTVYEVDNDKFSEISSAQQSEIKQVQFNKEGSLLVNSTASGIDIRNAKTGTIINTIQVADLIKFVVNDSFIIAITNNEFGYQFFDFNGKEISKKFNFAKSFQTFSPALLPIGDYFAIQSFKRIVFADRYGDEDKFELDTTFQNFHINKFASSYVLWDNKRIRFVNSEGHAGTQILADNHIAASIIPITNSQKQALVVDTLILFQSENGKPSSFQIQSHYAGLDDEDNGFIAVGMRDGKIEVWDIKKEQRIATINHSHVPNCIQLDIASNRLFVSDYLDSSIYEYSLKSEQGKFLKKQAQPITSVYYSDNHLTVGNSLGEVEYGEVKNGNFKTISKDTLLTNPITAITSINDDLLVASYGRIIKVKKDLSDLEKANLFIAHNAFITDISVAPEQKFFASAANDNAVKIWDAEKMQLIKSYNVDTVLVNKVRLFSMSEFIVRGASILGGIVKDEVLADKINNPPLDIVLQAPNNNAPDKLIINKDGSLLAVNDKNTVKVRDLKSGFLLSEFQTSTKTVNGIAFTEDGKIVIVAAGNGLEYFDAYTGESLRVLNLKPKNRSIHDVEVLNNSVIGINHHGWHYPVYYHKNSGAFLGQFSFNVDEKKDKHIIDLKCSPNKKYIATYGSNFVKIFDISGSAVKQIVAIPREKVDVRNEYWMDILDFSNDSKYLMYVDMITPNHLKIIDIAANKIIKKHEGKLGKFGKDGAYIFMNSNTTLALSNVHSEEQRPLDIKHMEFIKNIAYNEASDIFATGDLWGNIKIIEGKFGSIVNEINLFDQYTYQANVSNDNRYIVFNNKWGLYTFDLKHLRRNTLPCSNYPFSAVFSPSSDNIYFRKESSIYVQHLETGEIDSLFETGLSAEEVSGNQISQDGNILFFKEIENDVWHFYDLNSKKLLKTIDNAKLPGLSSYVITSLENENGKYLIYGNVVKGYKEDTSVSIHAAKLGMEDFVLKPLTKEIKHSAKDMKGFDKVRMNYDLKVYKLSPSRKLHIYMEGFSLKMKDLTTDAIIFQRDNPISGNIIDAAFDANEQYIFLAFEDGTIEMFDVSQRGAQYNYGKKGNGLKKLKTFKANSTGVERMSVNKNILFVRGTNSSLSMFDINNNCEKIIDVNFIRDRDQIVLDKDGYYFTTKYGAKYLAFKKGTEIFPFELFDFTYNRPDKVLAALQKQGLSSDGLVKAYENAYKKRAAKNLSSSTTNQKMPIVSAKTKDINKVVYDSKLSIPVSASSFGSKLEALNVLVNGVPYYGSNGHPISGKSWNGSVSLQLSTGENNIKISVRDDKGIESYPEVMNLNYVPPSELKPDLYVVALSVSDYESDHDLKYAKKDGNDIVNFFAGSEKYSTIYVDTLFDKNATRENFLALKSKLLQSKPDDKVVLFVSGHGLLDKNYDFYFATYDCDFKDPSRRGINYAEIDWMLDSIPARKKLLLIDACHSGEVDKESVEKKKNSSLAPNVVATYSGKKGVEVTNNSIGLENSYVLMQDLFANLNRGSGTMVIAAAAGDSYAEESSLWNNGVFTYSLLNGLKNKTADLDNNRNITISELRDYVYKTVEEETNGRQKPTARQENLEWDWSVW